jgi:hypothetical protein
MIPSHPARAGLARLVAEPRRRLRRTLGGLDAQLRAAIAAAVGQAVAGVVHQALQSLLTSQPGRADSASPATRSPGRSPSLLDTPDPGDDGFWRGDDNDLPNDEDLNPQPWDRHQVQPPDVRLRAAVAVGARTTVWWFDRRIGHANPLTALGAGLLVGLAAYLGGPWVAAGLALAGPALRLLALSEAATAGASALGSLTAS